MRRQLKKEEPGFPEAQATLVELTNTWVVRAQMLAKHSLARPVDRLAKVVQTFYQCFLPILEWATLQLSA